MDSRAETRSDPLVFPPEPAGTEQSTPAEPAGNRSGCDDTTLASYVAATATLAARAVERGDHPEARRLLESALRALPPGPTLRVVR